jgi:hypothetical protein
MKSQKKDEKKEIIVLDEGIKTNASGDPVHAQSCCFVVFIIFRGR